MGENPAIEKSPPPLRGGLDLLIWINQSLAAVSSAGAKMIVSP